MEIYRGLRVAVTGGHGFLGRNLVRRLVGLGSRVVIVDRSVPADAEAIASAAEMARAADFVCADIRDQGQMDRLVGHCDILFSLAGKSGSSDSMHDSLTDLDVNCRGHLTLLEAARKCNPKMRIVFPSSRLVYGKSQCLPVDEGHPTEPASIYGVHKLTCEKYYLLYNRLYGIRSTILRLTNPFGPHQAVDGRGFGIVNKFMLSAVSGVPIQVFGEGTQLRDYVFVDDVVEAMLLAGVSDRGIGEVFNVGRGLGIAIGQMAELIVRICGSGGVVHVPWPAQYAEVETGDFVASIEKVGRTFHWSPKTGLEPAISKSLEYYRKAGVRLAEVHTGPRVTDIHVGSHSRSGPSKRAAQSVRPAERIGE
jgi:UDP-glucose 4-epimerase